MSGDNAKIQQLELLPSSRSLESSDLESKNLHNISKHRRMETINPNKGKSKYSIKTNDKFNYRKSSVESSSLMIVENQLVPHTTLNLKKKLKLGLASKRPTQAKIKSLNRYQNSSVVAKTKEELEKYNQHNISTETPKRNVDKENQKLRRYNEVNASVEEHLRKYEYLIPDLRQKKFDLLKQILGEKSFEDVQYQLTQKKLANNFKGSRALKHEGEKSHDKFLSKTSDPEISPKSKSPKLVHESPSYPTHKGKLKESYQNLGGLGHNKDEKWEEVNGRRRNMLSFSNKVNDKNRQILKSTSPGKDDDSSIIESLMLRSGMTNNSKLNTLRERREKALMFAKTIKKPKIVNTTNGEYNDERFTELDNKQYLLENQKIKMLFG